MEEVKAIDGEAAPVLPGAGAMRRGCGLFERRGRKSTTLQRSIYGHFQRHYHC